MKIYCVGGAVRDELLGRPVEDRDWVVVGATPEEMVAMGFRPVGRDFPVFLHPETHEEYALARTERKSGKGHQGFTFHASPEVTLEEDLARRDLTVNAIAKDEDGRYIDPYGGLEDLRARRLRHVGPAFAEDPLRVLRVARLAARLGFQVAPETLALMRRVVASGELAFLSAERVWQELARGLMAAAPSRMLDLLAGCGAMAALWPALAEAWREGRPRMERALELAGGDGADLPRRFALLLAFLGEAQAATLAQALKAPGACVELGRLAAGLVREAVPGPAADAARLLSLVERSDAIRRPERFAALLDVCSLYARSGDPPEAFARARLERAREDAAGVDGGAIAARLAGPGLKDALRAARLEAVRSGLEREDPARSATLLPERSDGTATRNRRG